MKETTLSAMPPCFEKWCAKFDDLWKNPGQKKGFRYYLTGLLGESKRKNIAQMTDNIIGSSYHNVHHFISKYKWSTSLVNERRLKLMDKCNQTRIRNGFALIIDDSGHRKSGNFTDGVGRQYIGEIGKTDNGIVIVTTHLYDGVRSLPLDVELYQHADSLPKGKEDKNFVKKPDIALKLINKTIERKYHPGIVLIDGGYGNNSTFLKELEKLRLNYIGGLAKNRLASVINLETGEKPSEKRLDQIILSLPKENFEAVTLEIDKPKTVWVATIKAETNGLKGQRTIAIVMNANSVEEATEIDYLITNESENQATGQWIVKTFSNRNYIEKFYREAKGCLGLKEYQTRKKEALIRHFILVFTAYTFIIYQQLMGGLRKRYAKKSLTTFAETLEAFLTGISDNFLGWLQNNMELFAEHKACRGFVWG
ncbi:IS701 family transposase [Pleurocapsales cyanobacterium LEGE 10410]|nr:IS701 family transposase [Pleurocapsales cyanobacterium LEGE 10410]